MLYHILKPFINLCLRTFFRSISVVGGDNLKLDGPIIFVSNHPNAFLDPLLLVIIQKPKLQFIAGAEWFGKGLKNWIFRSQFNMIPVIRPWLKKVENQSNKDMFINCYDSLANDARILIYPEGTSVTVTKIRELKTGAMRMKLGADARMDKKVSIIPVGLNYYGPGNFQTDVVINIGEPIAFDDSGDAENKEYVRQATDKIKSEMAKLVLHYEEENFTELASQVRTIFGSILGEDLGINDLDIERKFGLRKGILEAVNYFRKESPNEFGELRPSISEYHSLLQQSGLDPRFLNKTKGYGLDLFIAILGAPIILIATLFNGFPYYITKTLFHKVLRPKFSTEYEPGKLNPSFLGSMAFLLGMVIFSIWYAAVLGFSLFWITFYQMLILILVMYWSGILGMMYLRVVFRLFEKIKVRKRSNRQIVQELKTRRVALITRLNKLKKEYFTILDLAKNQK